MAEYRLLRRIVMNKWRVENSSICTKSTLDAFHELIRRDLEAYLNAEQ